MKEIYVAFDGDDIGTKIEYLMLTNQLELLKEFSESIDLAVRWIQNILVDELNAHIVFCGGDNLLASVKSYTLNISKLEFLMARFLEISGCTLSIGLGSSTSDAYLALRMAKVSGKNRFCKYGKVDVAK